MNEIKQDMHSFGNGIKTMFKEFVKKDTNKKQRANMWTFSRLICAIIIPILTTIGAITNSLPILIAAFTTAGFGAITDFFDGRSARKHNSVSKFGELLDAVTDKVFSVLLGISLSILNPVFLLNIAGEVAITITNFIYKVKHEDIKIKSSKIGKIKQWPLSLTFVLGIISILFPQLTAITNTTIFVTLMAQLATMTNYILDNEKSVKKLEREKLLNEQLPLQQDKEKKVPAKSIDKGKQTLFELRQTLIELRQTLINIANDNKETKKEKVKKRKK